MKKVIFFSVLVILSLYVIESLVISMTLRSMVQSSNESFGFNYSYKDTVSDAIYKKMCFRNGYSITPNDNPRITESKTLFGPISYHWFVGGKATYWYSYAIYDENGTLAGSSWRIPVTISYTVSSGKLLITNYYEPL